MMCFKEILPRHHQSIIFLSWRPDHTTLFDAFTAHHFLIVVDPFALNIQEQCLPLASCGD
jgi:hypothetical protein